MEIFEIHITGDEKIIAAGEELGIKTIVIDLLKPDKAYHRTEYITSHVHRTENYDKCKVYVDDLVDKLNERGVEIKRVKIECPYYLDYQDQSLYFEIHYETLASSYPLSKNRGKSSCLCTVRTYNKKYWLAYRHNQCGPKPELVMELCLYDTNIGEDKDWFDLYEQ